VEHVAVNQIGRKALYQGAKPGYGSWIWQASSHRQCVNMDPLLLKLADKRIWPNHRSDAYLPIAALEFARKAHHLCLRAAIGEVRHHHQNAAGANVVLGCQVFSSLSLNAAVAQHDELSLDFAEAECRNGFVPAACHHRAALDESGTAGGVGYLIDL